MHKVIQPKIMYFGTPVVLVSTLNEDGTANLAPISSAWWLGQNCMLGIGTRSKTVENLLREKQCVLNLPSANMVDAVDRLALTTGKNPVPDYKTKMNFIYEPNKFERAGLTQIESELVNAPRAKECPVHLEAIVQRIHHFGKEDSNLAGIEVEIIRVHIEEELLNSEKRHYIDSDKWKPLIMSFCEFYGTGNKIHRSRLAEVF
ncbi:MAG: flavin reductase family protein [Melioribacteraceae bacterium]|nr:MAG: flavin reductase family protein [Melioribacteraceae bacterium]